MDCQKCSGLMSYEGFYGSESDAVWYYPGWRCVHCGDVIDNVISLNRRLNNGLHTQNNGERVNGRGYTNGNGHGTGYGRKNGNVKSFVLKTASAVHDDDVGGYEED